MELVDNYYNDAEHIETVICCLCHLIGQLNLEIDIV